MRRTEGVEPRQAHPVVGARAGARKHGLQGRRRAHLRGRRRTRCVAARHGAGTGRWRPRQSRNREVRSRSLLHHGDARPRRERRLQRAGDDSRPAVARRGAGARRSRASCVRSACLIRRITCGRRCASMRGLRRRSSICSTRGSTRGFRRATSRRRRLPPQSRRGLGRCRCSTRTASSAVSSTRCSRRSAPIFISSAMTAARSSRSRSSTRAASSTACRGRRRFTRFSSIRRASRACICASARWRAAASAGRTGRRISAPRCWAW